MHVEEFAPRTRLPSGKTISIISVARASLAGGSGPAAIAGGAATQTGTKLGGVGAASRPSRT
jgi:hypothetical protein